MEKVVKMYKYLCRVEGLVVGKIFWFSRILGGFRKVLGIVQKIHTEFYKKFMGFYLCYYGGFTQFPHRYTTTTNILLR